MASCSLVNGHILQGTRFVPGEVVIDGGRIVASGPGAGEGANGERIDLKGAVVSSGLLDLHVHGLKDKLCANDDLAELGAYEAEFGATGFLAGLVARRTEFPKLLETKRLEMSRMRDTSRCLGLYLEGPFLALTGAIPADALEPVDMGYARELLASGGGAVKVMAVSPELPGVIELVELLVSSGVTVAVAHTDASPAQMTHAVNAGACVATHLYNVLADLTLPSGAVKRGMKLPDVTEPGCWPVCGYDVLVADDRVTCEVLADGVHVHPVKAQITYKAKGVDRLALITDSNKGAGLPPGRYEIPGWGAVAIRAGDAVRDAELGWLAGSQLTMDEAVRRSQRVLGCDMASACVMASRTVADVLGLGDRLGRIAAGYDADLTVFDDTGEVLMTIVAGEIVFRKGDRE